jgi:hypothetical protein
LGGSIAGKLFGDYFLSKPEQRNKHTVAKLIRPVVISLCRTTSCSGSNL